DMSADDSPQIADGPAHHVGSVRVAHRQTPVDLGVGIGCAEIAVVAVILRLHPVARIARVLACTARGQTYRGRQQKRRHDPNGRPFASVVHEKTSLYPLGCGGRSFCIQPNPALRIMPRATYRPYFFLNLSTRPPASRNFCLPVKNGWQLEHTSTLMFERIEPVSNVLPQAQVAVVT